MKLNGTPALPTTSRFGEVVEKEDHAPGAHRLDERGMGSAHLGGVDVGARRGRAARGTPRRRSARSSITRGSAAASRRSRRVQRAGVRRPPDQHERQRRRDLAVGRDHAVGVVLGLEARDVEEVARRRAGRTGAASPCPCGVPAGRRRRGSSPTPGARRAGSRRWITLASVTTRVGPARREPLAEAVVGATHRRPTCGACARGRRR